LTHYFSEDILVYCRTYDKNSIMHTNPHMKIIKGIVYNYKYVIQLCKNNNIFPPIVGINVTNFMVQLYIEYLKCAKNSPELINYNLEFIKYYYKNIYKVFEKINGKVLNEIYYKRMPELIKLSSPKEPSVNLGRFLNIIKKEVGE